MSGIDYEYIFDPEEGLCCNGKRICGFNAEVVKVKKIMHRESNEADTLYCVEVTKSTGAKEKLWHKELSKIDYFSSYRVNVSLMDRSSRQLLLNKLMHEAEQLVPENDTGDETGLWNLDGGYTYVLEKGVKLKGGCHTSVMRDDMKKKALLDYINLVPGVTVILFFASILGALKPFLHMMKIKCRVALALVGPPGTLKSTIAREYFLWGGTDRNEILFTSYNWEKQAEGVIYKKAGENVLLDDVRKLSDSENQNRQMGRLEVFIHNYTECQGDCANLIVTGEDMVSFGKFSSVDRFFQVRMPNMDAAEVEGIKRKFNDLSKGVIYEMIIVFIQNMLGKLEEAKEKIESYCSQHRIWDNALKGREPLRSQDHAFFIQLSEYMFRSYVFDIGKEEVLRSALDSQRQIFEPDVLKQSNKEHPQNYLEVFYKAIICGQQVKAYSNWDEYERAPKGTAYLIMDKKLHITSDTLLYGIISYLGYTVTRDEIVSCLDKGGVLDKYKAGGYQKGDRRHGRHYVVVLWLLIKKLEEQGFPISQGDKEILGFPEM